jgi:hypothetical protein
MLAVLHSWTFQGNITFSPNTTLQIGYIKQVPIRYSLHLQPCIPFFNNNDRYLQCVNGSWICPDKYFFNENVCEYWRSFHSMCLTGQWCDSSNYPICTSLMGLCTCNNSMQWDGSTCNPGTDTLRMFVDEMTSKKKQTTFNYISF